MRVVGLGSVVFASIALFLSGGDAYTTSKEHCAAAWASADADGDGFLTRHEAAHYLAMVGAGDKSIADGRLSQSDFMRYCQAGLFDRLNQIPAAPLKGANSFTEAEARERILGRSYRNVSTLQKDADGIWRGTAELNGIQIEVAVDYKGNVVPK
jgi:hypothetical protein